MAKSSVILLDDTGIELEATGKPARADGYFGQKDGLHTITITLNNFTGRVRVEATLETEPAESDWFPIVLGGLKPFVQYPINPNNPTSDLTTGIRGDSGVDAYTFQGNFVWIRASIDKTYVVPTPQSDTEKSQLGSITKILLNN